MLEEPERYRKDVRNAQICVLDTKADEIALEICGSLQMHSERSVNPILSRNGGRAML
jgi:hypothetical protein